MIAEFVAELKRLAATCEFGQYLNDALRDRFVCGLLHEGMQKHLLSEPDLTFTRAVEIAQGIAAAEKNIQDFRRKEITTVGKVSFAATRKDSSFQAKSFCSHFGRSNHLSKNCYFKEAVCHNCEKKGHIASICRTPKRQKGQVRSKSTYRNRGTCNTKWLQQATPQEKELQMFHLGSSASRPFNLNAAINGTLVPLELDTGAAVSITSVNTQKNYFPNIKLNKSNDILRTYTSEKC